jgi:hypothetical protein
MEGGAVGHNIQKGTTCCFINSSYMAMSGLTYILGFSVKFFFQPIYIDYTN